MQNQTINSSSSISSAVSISEKISISISSGSEKFSKKEIIEEKEQTSKISEAILIMMFLLVLNEVLLNYLAKIKLRYQGRDRSILRFINGTALTTTIGLLAGITLDFFSEELLLKDLKAGFTQIFLIILLPPILFESAINMETGPFFKNFGTIQLYAVFGTLLACFVTGTLLFTVGWMGIATAMPLEICMAFGALISATDPVAVLSLFKQMNTDKNLFAIIFGESVLNDAVAIICFDSMIKSYSSQDPSLISGILNFILVFIGSIFIGFVIGVISAYVIYLSYLKILKNKSSQEIDPSQQDLSNNHTEATIILIVPWVSYLIAQGLSMSGIVSIIFCGISMARYAIPNLSNNGKRQLNHFYHALAYNFETSIFLFIGIGVVGFDLAWSAMGAGLIIFSLIGVFFGRFVNIYLMTRLNNLYRPHHVITKEWMFLMWFSGLRGAMAYALSLQSVSIFHYNDYGNIMLTVTLIIVLINIYIQGSLLPIVVQRCRVEQDLNKVEQEYEDDDSLVFNRLKMIIGQFDQKILQAHLINQSPTRVPLQEEFKQDQEQNQQEKTLQDKPEVELSTNLVPSIS